MFDFLLLGHGRGWIPGDRLRVREGSVVAV